MITGKERADANRQRREEKITGGGETALRSRGTAFAVHCANISLIKEDRAK